MKPLKSKKSVFYLQDPAYNRDYDCFHQYLRSKIWIGSHRYVYVTLSIEFGASKLLVVHTDHLTACDPVHLSQAFLTTATPTNRVIYNAFLGSSFDFFLSTGDGRNDILVVARCAI